MARSCSFPYKCRKYGSKAASKHATPLHDAYAQFVSDDVGATKAASSRRKHSDNADAGTGTSSGIDCSVMTRKLGSMNKNVFQRTSAMRVLNPRTGKSILAYAQHDTASQATLITERLKDELGLDVKKKFKMIRTIAQETTKSGGLTSFELQSLLDDKIYSIKYALIVPDFVDDEGEACLPHSVNVVHLEHFKGIEIPIVPERKNIDILIGQTDKGLLTVLEEREGDDPDDPNYVLTRLGPIASGGRVDANSRF